MRKISTVIAAVIVIGAGLAMVTSTLLGGFGPIGRSSATGSGASTVTAGTHLFVANKTIKLIGTAIVLPNGKPNGALNSSTARPWGEVYDPLNHCTYVTENPGTSPASQGYLTQLGTPQPIPTSQIIPGGRNPQGIAWAQSYAFEPTGWKAAFHYGILVVADTGSNNVSFFGIPPLGTGGQKNCNAVYLQTVTSVPYWGSPSGALLAAPWDVVYDLSTQYFYVTWAGSNAVSTFDGPSVGCEFQSNLTTPLGLSVNATGSLEVANFAQAGWVTALVTKATDDTPAAQCMGAASVSASIYDRAVWTVYAPALANYSMLNAAKDVVGVADSNYGIPGTVYGTGCATSTPLTHVMGEMKDAGLSCLNSVALDAANPTNSGAFGMAYNPRTQHVLQVLNTQGQVEGVDYTHVVATDNAAPAATPQQSVEVIWINSNAYLGAGPSVNGIMIVTNWGAGTLFVAVAL
jgi:hypothetical protein